MHMLISFLNQHLKLSIRVSADWTRGPHMYTFIYVQIEWLSDGLIGLWFFIGLFIVWRWEKSMFKFSYFIMIMIDSTKFFISVSTDSMMFRDGVYFIRSLALFVMCLFKWDLFFSCDILCFSSSLLHCLLLVFYVYSHPTKHLSDF